tara:strand:- start:4371 stop:4628 length:258 start_codon:yes stop_codon:yes gene_type:complete
MLSRNIQRLTASIIKKSPYTFDVVWSKDNYILIKLNPKNTNYTPPITPTPAISASTNSNFVYDKHELIEIRELDRKLIERFVYIV